MSSLWLPSQKDFLAKIKQLQKRVEELVSTCALYELRKRSVEDLASKRAEAAEARVLELERAEQLIERAVVDRYVAEERAAIVAWLLKPGYDDRDEESATAIEAGAHREHLNATKSGKGGGS